jgi:hypothetical protein
MSKNDLQDLARSSKMNFELAGILNFELDEIDNWQDLARMTYGILQD